MVLACFLKIDFALLTLILLKLNVIGELSGLMDMIENYWIKSVWKEITFTSTVDWHIIPATTSRGCHDYVDVSISIIHFWADKCNIFRYDNYIL